MKAADGQLLTLTKAQEAAQVAAADAESKAPAPGPSVSLAAGQQLKEDAFFFDAGFEMQYARGIELSNGRAAMVSRPPPLACRATVSIGRRCRIFGDDDPALDRALLSALWPRARGGVLVPDTPPPWSPAPPCAVQLGFLAAILVEAATGKGIILQLVMYGKLSGLLGPMSGF